MVFSSIFFLFFFLPVVLGLYCLVGPRLRNFLLLLASLLFYAWGEGGYVLLMLCSISMNYIFGFLVDPQSVNKRRIYLTLAVVANLIPLIVFKYSEFLLDSLQVVLRSVDIPLDIKSPHLHLPIGISFFTFQALSYVIDVYRGVCRPQKNLLNLGLYIALFPQLIAGPIVRYHDIARQLLARVHSLEGFSSGCQRFILGLGKKVLLANPMGAMADRIFALDPGTLSTEAAWIGVLCYSLQIFFDFSGYSDMAIGLGRMFGFHFLENFNYPYISRSIREFWRRWHISLSTWFRDYLYIPLGGNKISATRTSINLFLVFFLCGLWHGASMNFIIWGCAHGLFLILERGSWGRLLNRLPSPFRHLYFWLVLLNTWVLFRAETLSHSLDYFKAMYGASAASAINPSIAAQLDPEFFVVLLAALLFSFPVLRLFDNAGQLYKPDKSVAVQPSAYLLDATRLAFLAFVLLVSTMSLANGSYNPFIYFRF